MLCARVGFKDELDGCNRGILDTTHKMQWISGANPMFDGRIEGQVFVLIDGNRAALIPASEPDSNSAGNQGMCMGGSIFFEDDRGKPQNGKICR